MIQSQALSILKTGVNVFLTGEPGSGKTHTINEYVAHLRSLSIEPAITASTGIAATHIGGMTIHSWSGIGIKTKLSKQDLNNITSSKYIVSHVRKAKVLIIEEVSMLTGETLSMVDAVCREIKGSPEPFGGMQVIFVGDFFQLPPVVRREVQENTQTELIEKPSNYFAYDSPAWTEANPIVCYLTEQYRQDDSDFLGVLSSIRKGTFGSDHLSHLENRKIERESVPDNIPKLFSHNLDVDRINDGILAKLPGEQRVFTISTQGPDVLVAVLKKGCLSPETLYLKADAAVMFTKNNPKEGFVNGTLGTVEGFHKISGYPLVKTRGGRRIEVEPMDWTMEENGKIRARIAQLPLRLAWAITVHKSQGMSLDSAVMDLSDVFEFGQGYVALSRVRRLSGLYILGWNNRAFQVHPQVLEKDGGFRLSSSDIQIAFSKISSVELQKRQDDFISLCGGKRRSISQDNSYKYQKTGEKPDTYKETLILWNKGLNVLQIAKVRSLSEHTIFDHIEKLNLAGKINRADLPRLLTPALTHSLPKIHTAFQQLNTDRLSPVFEKLNGEYSYDELRIARIMLGEK